MMNRPGDDFFAAAALARDEDGCVTGGDLLHLAENMPHRVAAEYGRDAEELPSLVAGSHQPDANVNYWRDSTRKP